MRKISVCVSATDQNTPFFSIVPPATSHSLNIVGSTKTMATRKKGGAKTNYNNVKTVSKGYFYSNDSDNDDVVLQVLGLPCTVVSKISVS